MTKPGHEAPLSDNTDPANMHSDRERDQMRLGDAVQDTTPQPESPKTLPLTDAEETRVEKLMETMGLDRNTAIRQTLSRSRANQFLGFDISSKQKAKYTDSLAAKKTEPEEAGPTVEELLPLIRSHKRQNGDSPTDQAA